MGIFRHVQSGVLYSEFVVMIKFVILKEHLECRLRMSEMGDQTLSQVDFNVVLQIC